jgi:hypothetical protein
MHDFATKDEAVESRKGASPEPTGSRLFPFPAHQTGRARFLEHPAFRLVSPQRPRKGSHHLLHSRHEARLRFDSPVE